MNWTTKEFYIIPTAYASKGGDSNEIGFNKQQFNEDGSTSVVFVTPTIYKQTDDYEVEVYYLFPKAEKHKRHYEIWLPIE